MNGGRSKSSAGRSFTIGLCLIMAAALLFVLSVHPEGAVGLQPARVTPREPSASLFSAITGLPSSWFPFSFLSAWSVPCTWRRTSGKSAVSREEDNR